MPCLKCGRDTPSDQVFCDECLEKMKQYPVKPDTPVTLPKRRKAEYTVLKKVKTTEDLLADAQRSCHRLKIAVVTLSIFLSISLAGIGLLIYYHKSVPSLGQNYTTETSAHTTPSSVTYGTIAP